MIKNLKTFIFSTALLASSAFSAQAMLSHDEDPFAEFEADAAWQPPVPVASVYDPEEQEQVYAFCEKYNFSDTFTQDVYDQVKGKAFKLHKHGVPNLDYYAAFLLYNQSRDPSTFSLLFNLFKKAPFDARKSIWNDLVAWEAYRSFDPPLNEFYYDSEGTIKISERVVPGTVSLKEKLFALPYQEPFYFEGRLMGYNLKQTDGSVEWLSLENQ